MEYTYRIIEQEDDYEGRVIATLINSNALHHTKKAVLYIHGYIDYFFQDHMAERFNREGYNFYAVDLRKYGRSLLEHQHPNYCSDIKEYYPDIEVSINEIIKDGNDNITLLGHSTGGLITALWVNDCQKNFPEIKYVVLNSPFLEFNTFEFKRSFIVPVAGMISKIFPYISKSNEISPHYARSIHKSFEGEWDFDLQLKPEEGFPLYFAWLRAIHKAHTRIKKGLHIDIPILVMSSSYSYNGKYWCDCCRCKDTVLNVAEIRHYSHNLGKNVSITEIEGALHDIFLSEKTIREKSFEIMFNWLKNNK